MTGLLIALIVACGAWAVTAGVLITRDLEKRGFPVKFLWWRVMLLRYLEEYRRLTLRETGRVGALFYHYVVPLVVALVLAIVLVVRELN